MSEHLHLGREKMLPTEVAASASLVGITAGSMIHAADSYLAMDIPGADELPLLDHTSSMHGGYFVGFLADSAVERVATFADNRDRPQTANKIRKLGLVATFASSLASQLIVESNPRFGYGDKLDIIFGVAATVPAVIHSRALSRSVKHLKARKRFQEAL